MVTSGTFCDLGEVAHPHPFVPGLGEAVGRQEASELFLDVPGGGELADVLTYCYQLAMRLYLDPDLIVLDKLEKTRVKYPAPQG